ncbi:MAG: hypothetical protein AABZ53_10720 [Planctomycetota bacterium]
MKTTSQRMVFAVPHALVTASLGLVALGGTDARAQAQLSGAESSYGGYNGLNVLPGSNTWAQGYASGNTISASYTGDMVTSLIGGNSPGTYYGQFVQGTLVPFTVGALPVRVGDASMHANFKMVASGGDGVEGGDDPIVTVSVISRLCQQVGAAASVNSDPWLSAIEFTQSYTQNGNGLRIIDDTLGPAHSGYILTPGNYYLLQQIVVSTSFTRTGLVQPTRGMTLELGGDLTAGTYSGFTYSFDWQTVPAPGAMAPLATGGLAMLRRRR